MSDWAWEYDPDGYGDTLPPGVRAAVEHIAADLAVANSMVYLDGAAYEGQSPPVRREYGTTTDGHAFMVTYVTDVRGERVVVVSVSVH
ncbi:hypothetical protein ACH427_14410 [Streptomyces sp. NPDC020379]|uniref:hypothetical protein n=1 Tax=Streptomyces sp. NPDC020379 TaxID=3365071 RepID=UPI0037BC4EBF